MYVQWGHGLNRGGGGMLREGILKEVMLQLKPKNTIQDLDQISKKELGKVNN